MVKSSFTAHEKRTVNFILAYWELDLHKWNPLLLMLNSPTLEFAYSMYFS